MRDIIGQEVNIGDKVYIAHGKLLYEAVFIKETKTSFIVKTKGQDRGYSIPKNSKVINPAWDKNAWATARGNYTIPYYVYKDISQEPCKRIIKLD